MTLKRYVQAGKKNQRNEWINIIRQLQSFRLHFKVQISWNEGVVWHSTTESMNYARDNPYKSVRETISQLQPQTMTEDDLQT